MDHDEWQAAYWRAQMDLPTARDFISDLQLERSQLLLQIARLQADIQELQVRIRHLEVERDAYMRMAMQ